MNRQSSSRIFLILLPFLHFCSALSWAAERADWQQYVDSANGFSFAFPSDYILSKGHLAVTEDWWGDPNLGNPPGEKLIKISSKPLKKSSDYVELSIWKSSDTDCSGRTSKSESQFLKFPPTKIIGGSLFERYDDAEAGMNHGMSLLGYTGNRNKACWRIQLFQSWLGGDPHPLADGKGPEKMLVRFLDSFNFRS